MKKHVEEYLNSFNFDFNLILNRTDWSYNTTGICAPKHEMMRFRDYITKSRAISLYAA